MCWLVPVSSASQTGNEGRSMSPLQCLLFLQDRLYIEPALIHTVSLLLADKVCKTNFGRGWSCFFFGVLSRTGKRSPFASIVILRCAYQGSIFRPPTCDRDEELHVWLSLCGRKISTLTMLTSDLIALLMKGR